jgi:hypothetical protein
MLSVRVDRDELGHSPGERQWPSTFFGGPVVSRLRRIVRLGGPSVPLDADGQVSRLPFEAVKTAERAAFDNDPEAAGSTRVTFRNHDPCIGKGRRILLLRLNRSPAMRLPGCPGVCD